MTYDLIIIGAGPAGITAAIYCARKKIKFLVIAEELGGQVIENLVIENYTGYQEISGIELIARFEEHMKEFEFDLVAARALSVQKGKSFQVLTARESFESKTVLVCTGAIPKYLGIPGEKEYKNRGLSYCATCDGPLFAEKEVAVIGGGNTALTTVLQMEKIASRVYLIDTADALSADAVLIEKAFKSKKLTVYHGAKVLSVSGDRFLEGLQVMHRGRKVELAVQGIFINIGYMPATDLIKGVVALNEKDEIMVDHLNRTDVQGVFAAGDCTDVPYKQIIVAAGHGASAALSVNQFLLGSNE